MGSRATVLANHKPSGVASAGVRLTTVELKQQIHDSGICHAAIEMALTGRRPMVDKDSGEVITEELSEAAHVDMIKFIVKKVLPDAKEYDSKEDRATLDKWADVIAADPELAKG